MAPRHLAQIQLSQINLLTTAMSRQCTDTDNTHELAQK